MTLFKARETKHRFIFPFGNHYPVIANFTSFILCLFRRPYLALADLFTKLGVVCLSENVS